MKRFIFALFALSVAAAQAPSSYSVSDITLYGLNERHLVFYGNPGTVRRSSGTLTLSNATPSGTGLQMPNSLRVNGGATLKIPPARLAAFQVVKTTAGLRLITRVPMKAVYYNDGSRWYTLSGGVGPSQNIPVNPTPRQSLYGAGGLTSPEATALGNYLLSRGSPVVVGVIPSVPAKLGLTPAPAAYRSTALAVQIGVRDLSVVSNPDTSTVNPVSESVNVLTEGTQSLYFGEQPDTRLDAIDEELSRTWQLVAGNLVPTPPLPNVDFARAKVITVFMGQKPTGGYSLRYLESSLQGSTLRLRLEAVSPAPDRLTTQVITSPYIMLEVSRAVNAVAVEFVPTNP